MGGWYSPRGGYDPAALGGLKVSRFVEALAAEGVISGNFDPHMDVVCTQPIMAGPGNKPLHMHPLFNTLDVFGDGAPTAEVYRKRARGADAAAGGGSLHGCLPVAEGLAERSLAVPWFKHDRAEVPPRLGPLHQQS